MAQRTTPFHPRTLATLALGAACACANGQVEATHLQTQDLESSGATFDRNEIVPAAAFTDATTITRDTIQTFLQRTPYNRASFLATYSSNGVQAADAILAATQKYDLNPLVFLVRAEMDQGLIGQELYPSTPSRVEYVFGCGCETGGGACDPALAGFDLQVDCLGLELRESLDAIAANGVTAGGWGPNIAQTSADGQVVTPADASTAALYQYTPIVGTGSSGNWLFWNIWQNYAAAIGYAAPGP